MGYFLRLLYTYLVVTGIILGLVVTGIITCDHYLILTILAILCTTLLPNFNPIAEFQFAELSGSVEC